MFTILFLFLMVPLSRNHFHTPVSVRFPFFYVVITPKNGVFNNLTSLWKLRRNSCNNPSKWGLQQRNAETSAVWVGCDNPSKWGLQQLILIMTLMKKCCDNPTKWGLQQQKNVWPLFERVVITPQNGGFKNFSISYADLARVVRTPQNGVSNNSSLSFTVLFFILLSLLIIISL